MQKAWIRGEGWREKRREGESRGGVGVGFQSQDNVLSLSLVESFTDPDAALDGLHSVLNSDFGVPAPPLHC